MTQGETPAGTPALERRAQRDAAQLVGDIVSSRWILLAIAALAIIVYASTLNDWFSYDDFWFLRSGQDVSFGRYAVDAFDFRKVGDYPEFDRYRPLYPIAFWLQYQVCGLHALGYRIVLIALHLATVALVWSISLRVTKRTWAANLAALIFAVHPTYATAIGWIGGGNRVFVTAPYLASLLLFMRYLRLPPLQWLFGKQMFLAAERTAEPPGTPRSLRSE